MDVDFKTLLFNLYAHSTLMRLNSPNAQDRHVAITAFADAVAAYKKFNSGETK